MCGEANATLRLQLGCGLGGTPQRDFCAACQVRHGQGRGGLGVALQSAALGGDADVPAAGWCFEARGDSNGTGEGR